MRRGVLVAGGTYALCRVPQWVQELAIDEVSLVDGADWEMILDIIHLTNEPATVCSNTGRGSRW